MRPTPKAHYYCEGVSSLLILLFVYTAVSKLLELDVFRYVLSQSPLISRYASPLAAGLPVAELLVAGLLLLPRTRRAGLWGALGLMVLFTLYIGYMLLTASHLPCSCGGVLQDLSWQGHFFFNLVFTGLALSGLLLSGTKTVATEGSTTI